MPAKTDTSESPLEPVTAQARDIRIHTKTYEYRGVPMSIRFKCPKCNTILSAPDTSAGKKGQCSKCKTAMRIPTPSKPSKPAAPAKKETVKPAAEKPAVPPEKNITEQQVFASPQKQKSLSRNARYWNRCGGFILWRDIAV